VFLPYSYLFHQGRCDKSAAGFKRIVIEVGGIAAGMPTAAAKDRRCASTAVQFLFGGAIFLTLSLI
jgi:hypothetical protein